MKRIDFLVKKYRLSADGGVRRSLPLYTLSCCGRGYHEELRALSGISYGPLAAVGDGREWQTLWCMPRLTKSVDRALHSDPRWLRATRRRIQTRLRRVLAEFRRQRRGQPRQALAWIHEGYVSYLACLGFYNALWRYLEYGRSRLTPLTSRQLRTVAAEREMVGRWYHHFEDVLVRLAQPLSRQLRVPTRSFLMATRVELAKMLKDVTVSNAFRRELQRRCRGYAYAYDRGQETITTNRRIIMAVRRLGLPRPENTSRVTGTPAYAGRVRGVVVQSLSRRSLPKHVVYVTAMTAPHEAPLLKRCAAIVTDEGGLLSHVAIASRELKIPTIMRTKVATRIFKDGDRVEVDANSGSVKKL